MCMELSSAMYRRNCVHFGLCLWVHDILRMLSMTVALKERFIKIVLIKLGRFQNDKPRHVP